MPKPVRLAVLGAGLIGKRHVAHIIDEPEAELFAIVDPSSAGEAFASMAEVRWFPDFAAMITVAKPDGVIIATPNQWHVRNGLESVAAGIPALVEKPLADDVNAALELVETAEKAGIALLVGHHRRHNPLIQRAKNIIDSGRIGELVSLHCFFWLYKPDDYFDTAWRREKGAGPVLTNLIHDIDNLRYLCGDISSVQALQSNAIRGNPIEESAVILARFKCGALATINVSDTIVAPWSWELTTGENPVYPRQPDSCYFFGGTHGSLTVPNLELINNRGVRSWWEPLVRERQWHGDGDPLRLQIKQFCRVIRGEERPLVSAREGLETLRVIAAIQDAAQSGKAVEL